MPPPDEERTSGPDSLAPKVVLERFLRRYFADQDGEQVAGLETYQVLFPGHEELIARSFAALRDVEAEPLRLLRRGDCLGPYRIEREVGRGGQSVVYHAEDTRAGRTVAIKVLHPRLGLGADASLERFKREAEAAARIRHQRICPIYDVELAGASPYLVMPFIEGRTLARCIEERTPPVGSVDECLRLVERLAEALRVAHEAGVIHRDVKPENVIVGADGEPVLLDLGVAHTEEGSLTSTGSALGTLPYMAPEQVEGRGDVDGRVDVYGLGATLFECLTGRLPFEAPSSQRLAWKILHEALPDVRRLAPGLPNDVAVVVNTSLARDPARRYQTVAALARDLRHVLERRPIEARPPTSLQRFSSWCRRNPALALATSASFALLAAGLITALVLLQRVRHEERAKGRALGEREAALAAEREALWEVRQLADHRRLQDLEAEERDLWPVRAAVAARMRDWIERGRIVLERATDHRRTLAELERALEVGELGEGLDRVTLEWHAEGLRELVARSEEFEGRVERVEARAELAERVARETVEERADAWARAADELARDERFDGFELVPQVGLVPLGSDPETGLLEFAHIESGRVPVRDETLRLELEPDSGLVFVLLSGGRFTMGATAPTAEHPVGSAHVDPYAGSIAAPPHEVQLDPFLLSKFELTQGQWERLTGENPGYFQGEILKAVSDRDPLLPIEQVSWLACAELCRQRELALPTEAQWEFACRAGTTTIWFSGDEQESLIGFENLADEASARYRRQGEPFVPGMDDGAVTTAFVGSYDPNPFGLHDMTGNVLEWCADVFGPYSHSVRPGDGLREVPEVPARALRGGCFRDLGPEGTSAARHNGPPEIINPVVGFRPVFVLRAR